MGGLYQIIGHYLHKKLDCTKVVVVMVAAGIHIRNGGSGRRQCTNMRQDHIIIYRTSPRLFLCIIERTTASYITILGAFHYFEVFCLGIIVYTAIFKTSISPEVDSWSVIMATNYWHGIGSALNSASLLEQISIG